MILIYSNKIKFKNYLENSYASQIIKDSLVRHIDKKSTYFSKIKNTSILNKNNVKIGLDEVTISDNILKMRGWAFDEQVQRNFNDSIFVSLTSKNESYLFKTKLISRPDVTSYFKRENLDLSGFEILLIGDKIPSDTYKIGVIIKNDTIKAFSKTDHNISIK